MKVRFRQLFPWALLPYRAATSESEDHTASEAFARDFRWSRRTPESRLHPAAGDMDRVGWIVPFPFDAAFQPLIGAETSAGVGVDASLEVNEQGKYLTNLGFDPMPHYKQLFALNSETTEGDPAIFAFTFGLQHVGMVMGWAMDIPEGHMMAFLPLPGHVSDFDVAFGLLDHDRVSNLNNFAGPPVIMSPLREFALRRGQPFLRAIVFPISDLRVRARFEEIGSEQDAATSVSERAI